MTLLYHKVLTPEFLQKIITSAPTTGSNETEVQVGADSSDNEVIFRHKLLDKSDSRDLTVRITAAFEYNNPTQLYLLVSDKEYGVGFQLNDTAQYRTPGPYQGIHGDAYLRALEPGTPSSREEPVSSRRWPQEFKMTIKPGADSSWGMCYTALDGGHSYSAIYPKGVRSSDPLYLSLYRAARTSTYTINFIEVAVYQDSS